MSLTDLNHTLHKFIGGHHVSVKELLVRARENMQFKKVKKEIINCKKRDFADLQTCRFYAKNGVFLQIERNVVQKSTRMHNFW